MMCLYHRADAMYHTATVLFSLGLQVLEALENGVSQWPKLEGRFPQVRHGVVRYDRDAVHVF